MGSGLWVNNMEGGSGLVTNKVGGSGLGIGVGVSCVRSSKSAPLLQ